MEMLELNDRIIELYRDGCTLEYLAKCLNIPSEVVENILIEYKENNRNKRGFNDDFKETIAMRDLNGISRRQISIELGVNIATVKKACEKFGQSIKNKDTFENEHTKLDKFYDLSYCPKCHSKNVNKVEENTIFCKECLSEFYNVIDEDDNIHETHIINWEYID